MYPKPLFAFILSEHPCHKGMLISYSFSLIHNNDDNEENTGA